ncbi:NYN domain-containing protein [Streptosporangium sp. NPDC002607]
MITPTTRIDRFQASTSRGRRRLRSGRAMHLLDIENLTGASRPTTSEVAEVMVLYRRIVPIGPMDQFVVAVNHGALVAVGIAFHGVQLLARSGPDGADQALAEAARGDRMDQRFDRVVIGSGDGYFADLACWLAECGVHVTVVSQRESLSRRLRAEVSAVITLEPPAAQVA